MMSGEPMDLRSLLLLASRNPHGGRRRSDCRRGWDETLGGADEQHRSLVVDMLDGLIRELERDLRESLARRLLDLPGVPDDLLSNLAAVGSIARSGDPGGTTDGALLAADDDLVGIARHRATEHRLSVGLKRSLRRRMLSPSLVEERTDVGVEPAGPIDDALSVFLDVQAERLDDFARPRLLRDEIDLRLLRRVCWRLAAAVRAQILQVFDIDPSELDDRLEEAVLGLTWPPLDLSAGRTPPSLVIDGIADDLARRSGAGPKFLVPILRQGHVALFERLFCRLAAFDMPQLRRVLSDPSGRAFAIACRALEIEAGDFASLYLMRYQDGDTPVRDAKALAAILRLYRAIEPRDALHVLRQWRRDPIYVDAIETVGVAGAH